MSTVLDCKKRSKGFRKRANVVLAVLALTDVIAETIDDVHSNCGGLSDEEAGRRWCAARGKRPCYSALLVGDRWEWFKPQNGGAPGFDECRLPAIVWHQLRDAEGRFSFLSEALAYAAVGRAVKELAAVLGGPADVV